VEKSLSVLVVADSHCLRLEFQSLLGEMGHRMLGAATGSEARQILKREEPEIVVTDLLLPGFSGLDFIDWLKPKRPYVTIVALSNRNSRAKTREAIRRGAWDYLEKPLQRGELVAVLDNAVERAKLILGRSSRTDGCEHLRAPNLRPRSLPISCCDRRIKSIEGGAILAEHETDALVCAFSVDA